MMCYLGAPISLGLRAGEGTPTLCSKECHGSQPAGAAEKEEKTRPVSGEDYGHQTHNPFHVGSFCRSGDGPERVGLLRAPR